jgi:hypothetical protein
VPVTVMFSPKSMVWRVALRLSNEGYFTVKFPVAVRLFFSVLTA